MAKHVLSIEIGQQVTKVVEVDYKKKNPHVYRATTFGTPEDVIEDGVIRDKEVLAVAMREELRAADMLGVKDVIFSIASSRIATREVDFSNVQESKLKALVKATAQEHFPIDLTEYTLAYTLLETNKEGKSKSFKVQMLAAPDSLIANYYNFAQEMGWNIMDIDYFGNGSLQVLKKEIVLPDCACIQISGNISTITFLSQGNQLMQRTINTGVFGLAEAMVLSPDCAVEDMDSACDMLIRERLVCRTLEYDGLEEVVGAARLTDVQWKQMEEAKAARKTVTDSVGEIILSVMRVLDFFRSQHGGQDVSNLYITGMGAKIQGIEELFTNELGIQTQRMEHLVTVTFPRHFNEGLYNQTEYIPVIGAAIAPVGFESKDVALVQGSKDMLKVPRLVFGLGCVLAVAMAAFSLLTYFSAKSENDDLTARKASLEYINEVYTENENINKVYDQVNGIYTGTQNQNENLRALAEQLEEKLPSDMKVSNLVSDDVQVSMTLTSEKDLSVARMLMNLEEIDVLTDITIPSVSKDTDDNGKDEYSFTVTATYKALTSEDASAAQ